ncbi:unnamed protein product [Linum trigynum]|uniref:Uncharacterized protein n=1 Tax=Linum trigynum TaxID=586398 RepID=A0AAV2F823_9ROSI
MVMVAFATIFELRDPGLVLRINFEGLSDLRNTTTDGRSYETLKLALKFDGGDVNSIPEKATEGTIVTISKEDRDQVAAELITTNGARLRLNVGVHGRATTSRNVIIRTAELLTTVVRSVTNGLGADERTVIRLLLVICWGCFFWNLSLWFRLSSYVNPVSFYGDHV